MMTAVLLALTFVALAVVPCIIGIVIRASLQKAAVRPTESLHSQALAP